MGTEIDEMAGEVMLMECGGLLVRVGRECGGERCGLCCVRAGMCVQPGGRGAA